MQQRNWEDFVQFDANGRIIEHEANANIDITEYLADAPSPIATHTPGSAGSPDDTKSGELLDSELFDLHAFNLTAGVTYTFAQRGAGADGLEDPYMLLYGPGLTNESYITEDDDGGLGRTSMITYTPTVDGTYYVLASSWYHLATDQADPGSSYTLDVWQANPANDVDDTFEGAMDIGLGTTFGQLEAPNDFDMYKIEMTEGMVYSFTYAGGISGGGDFDGEPGENIAFLDLFDANGNPITYTVNYETGLSFFAEESGTYYLQVSPYDAYVNLPFDPMTGGYTLDVAEVDPATRDPLESLVWDSANNVPFVDTDGDGVGDTAYVYFAPAGENFGEFEPDDETPMATFGWEDFQIEGVMNALEEYEDILGVNYEITTDVEQATFRMLTTENLAYGARFYPQDPAYGSQQGIGTFNVISGLFTEPGSLERGGFSYAVVLHEFGHAHGIAHPHDTGGGSEVMLGVTASTGSLGVYDLNQGVYTVMSYNDGWATHPDGERDFSRATYESGWSATLGAFDIAVLQQRYGIINPHNTGDDVYTLAGSQDEAFYQTIWDTGGTDTIAYSGDQAVQIDLLAATLDYTPTGGGVVSFVHGIHGGYTIANGVVIENATGGEGDDVLLGNDAANVLTGNLGDDVLIGRDGADSLLGGDGADSLDGGAGNDLLVGGNDGDILRGGDDADRLDGGNASDLLEGGAGDDILQGGNDIDYLMGGADNDTLEGGNGADVLDGGAGDDVLIGGKGEDSYVFGDAGTDIILGYEKGETIDLTAFVGITDADVTVTRDSIFVDLAGSDDLTIFIEGGAVRMQDILFAPADTISASNDMHAQYMIA
ncbi:M10 family metallopeptidase C-terminal domain-containing protein [Sphingosinicella humi]|uniref:Peptidase M10 serralysin C-terminal domain-containing protein n=1 Tax=Allosphingosinicella humi TaxID=2068657 RepID=A0A2U2J1R9_9SPHN|nr:M10 family metallopeptidase C-terminal domain-containing protein [Sphingosinicella humi]PWG02254.1 hypothetical protein DF286_04770 [Sphingosinicella humi]